MHFIDENGENKFALMLEMCGGVDKLEALQTHKNNQVYERALRLLENYFNLDTAEQDTLLGAIQASESTNSQMTDAFRF